MYSTQYCITLGGWPDWDELFIEAGILLEGDLSLSPQNSLTVPSLTPMVHTRGWRRCRHKQERQLTPMVHTRGWRRCRYKQERQSIGPASMLTSVTMSECAPFVLNTRLPHWLNPCCPQTSPMACGRTLQPITFITKQGVPAHLYSIQ